MESLARHAVSLEKRLGVPAERLLTLPEDRSNPEAMADVYRALGRPDAPEGYAVQVVEGAPDYIAAYAGDLAKELHGLGASKAIVDKVVELTNRTYEAQIKAQNDASAADQVKIDGELKAQWGDQTDAMKQAVTNLLKDEIDATPNLKGEEKAARWEALKDELAGGLGKSPILFGLLARQVQARLEGNPLPAGDLAQSLGGALSVDQAKAAKNAFQADKTKMEAWRDAKHPNHKAVVGELERYNKVIVGASRKKINSQ
ncbi:hypothetical protein [Asticcacaulis taihuensis]|uniref:hypothetical protein n=1 Tax=Asticcacaulis taihuensis TaxID=260084 RepID=UPI0026EA5B56|nr:hypothetical protein [Asticcacaulis taihuensis]